MVRRKNTIKIMANTIMLSIVGFSFLLFAYSGGISGRSTSGCSCHGSSATTSVTVTIAGPATLAPSQQGSYTLTITGGPLAAAGCDISATGGTLLNANSDLTVMSSELTQNSPKTPTSGSVVFSFLYTAPAATGNQTLRAVGLSVNNTGGTGGDAWNNAPNFTVSVQTVTPVELKSFTANVAGNDVQLKWSTATEINNFGYKIDRKEKKSGTWEDIAFINGNGNSTISHNYTFTDRNLNSGTYTYRLVQTDINGSTRIYNLDGEVTITKPTNYEISQNYPNPFNPSTIITYQIPENGNVSLKIYNSTGQEVAQLVNGSVAAGVHEVSFNGAHLSSGVYYYIIRAGNFVQTKKMILMK
jgi:hypothetical protein